MQRKKQSFSVTYNYITMKLLKEDIDEKQNKMQMLK